MVHELRIFGVFVLLGSMTMTSADVCSMMHPKEYYTIQINTDLETTVLVFEVEGNSSEITLSQGNNDYLELDTVSRDIVLKNKIIVAGLVIELVINCNSNDDAQVTASHALIFVVQSVNHPPEFSATIYSFRVSEDAKVGSTVYTNISASDADDGNDGDILYTIVSDTNLDHFELKSDRNPEIVLTKKVDYEASSSFSFIVVAEDRGQNRMNASAKVEVNIIDVDDMRPAFLHNDYTATLTDDVPVGKSVNILPPLEAEDQDDIKVAVGYSIIDGKGFSIDEMTGEMTVNSPLTVGYVPIIVQVWQVDDPNQNNWVVVKIYVVATNNIAPSFEHSSYSATVSEATVIGTTVLTVRGMDPDIGSVLSYSLSTPSTHFEMRGENILLTKSLDYETDTELTFSITVTDGNSTSMAEVVITVTGVNDNTPQILNEQHVTVKFDPMTETVVHTIEAKDADRESSVSFHMKNGYPSDLFAVGLDDGIIKFHGTVDMLTQNEVYFLVKVRDDGHPYREAVVEINVQIMRHPTFKQSNFTVTRSEAEPIDAILFTVSASDDDFGASLEYAIIGNTNMFEISNSSGSVYLRQRLDYEKSHVHIINITASDTVNMATVTAELTVTDVNDNNPVILNKDVVDVTIDLGKDTIVHTIEASDADLDNLLSYHMISEQTPFSVNDKGIVMFSVSEKKLTVDVYHIQVEVRDNGTPPRSASVRIHVKLTRDLVFMSNYTLDVLENEAVNTVLVKVAATDDSFGNDVEYKIMESTSMFQIDKSSGEVILKESLDHEKFQHHIIHVIATKSNERATATVEIIVIDVNDNYPDVDKEIVNVIMEQLEQHAIVHPINANDKDLGTSLTYHMTLGKPYFSVDTNGVVKIAAVGSMSSSEKYFIYVMVRDDGTPYKQTGVIIIVRFLSILTFNPVNYHVTVSEAQATGSTLLVLTTNDDNGANIEYGSEETMSLFQVNKKSGSLKLDQMLDYEKKTLHTFNVIATDKKTTATATVTIEVTNTNDNSPDILNEENIYKTLERKTTEIVHKIEATDNDPTTTLTYNMSVGSPLFAVDSTGKVTINASLDQLTDDKYFILVKVQDNGHASRESTVSIIVDFTDPSTAEAVTQAGSDSLIFIIIGVGAGLLLIALFGTVAYGMKKRKILKAQLNEVLFTRQKRREISEPLEKSAELGCENLIFTSNGINYEDDLPPPENVLILDTTETVDLDDVSDGGTTVQENPLAMNGSAQQCNNIDIDDDIYTKVNKSEKMSGVEEIQIQQIYLSKEENRGKLSSFKIENADMSDSDSSTGSKKDLFPFPPKKILRFKTPSMEEIPDLHNIQMKL